MGSSGGVWGLFVGVGAGSLEACGCEVPISVEIKVFNVVSTACEFVVVPGCVFNPDERLIVLCAHLVECVDVVNGALLAATVDVTESE